MDVNRNCRIGVLTLALIAAVAIPVAPADAAEPAHVPGQVLVKFKPGVDKALKQEIFAGVGARALRATRLRQVSVLELQDDRVEGVVAQFANHPLLEYAEPNYYLENAEVPDDPDFGTQWHLRNTGQEVGPWGRGTPGVDISATHAWNVTTGSDEVIIAVMDTEVDFNHPDLAGNIFVNTAEIAGNGIDDDGNGYVDDIRGWDFVQDDNTPDGSYGHGTAVASMIACTTDNGIGAASAGYRARILPVKVTDSLGFSTAVEYAVLMGAQIINMSKGIGPTYAQIAYDATARADSAGVLMVCAAGNVHSDLDAGAIYFPASYPFDLIIGVASTGYDDEISGFSNYGPATVDLAAPGEFIYSALLGDDYGFYGGTGNGTSFAAPLVSGVLGLMYAKHGIPAPDQRRQVALEMKQRLLDSVDVLPQLAIYVGASGRLNAFLAVADEDLVAPAPITDAKIATVASSWVDLRWTAVGDDGLVGRASAYDLRVHDQPISEANWDQATRVAIPDRPLPAGAAEAIRIPGLTPDTAYYWAVKVLDEWGSYHLDKGLDPERNTSGLGNTGYVHTLPPPEIVLTPSAIETVVVKGRTNPFTFTIGNPRVAVLDYLIESEPGFAAVTVSRPAGSIDPFQAGTITVFADADALPCGVTRTYLRINSNDPEHPTVNLPLTLDVAGDGDIEVVATMLDFGDVVRGTPRSLFLDIANAGCSNLGIIDTVCDREDFRVATRVQNIAGEETHQVEVVFRPGSYGTVNGKLTINSFDADEPAVTVRLRGVGVTPPDIELDTAPLVSPELYTGATHTFALTVANLGGFPLSLAVDGGGAGWLAVPAIEPIVPGGSAIVPVTVSAAGLCVGQHGTLTFTGNDPDEPVVAVAVSMPVIAATDITAFPVALSWPSCVLPPEEPMSLVISNTGCDVLTVTSVTSSNPTVFIENDKSFVLAPGATREIRVGLALQPAGDYEGNIVFACNDPDEPVFNVPCLARFVAPDAPPGGADPETDVSPPRAFALHNVPNPFNPSTELRFGLEQAGRIELRIYDLRGRLIRVLDGSVRSAGPVAMVWNGQDGRGREVASGFYLCRVLRDGAQIGESGRLCLIR